MFYTQISMDHTIKILWDIYYQIMIFSLLLERFEFNQKRAWKWHIPMVSVFFGGKTTKQTFSEFTISYFDVFQWRCSHHQSYSILLNSKIPCLASKNFMPTESLAFITRWKTKIPEIFMIRLTIVNLFLLLVCVWNQKPVLIKNRLL